MADGPENAVVTRLRCDVVRAVVQRVEEASVRVVGAQTDEPGGDVVGAVARGLCVFVGVTHDDGPAEADALASKLWHLRIFDDDDGVMNRSAADLAGEDGASSDGVGVLVVSQFTLYGDTKKGRRPSWIAAARPEHAEPLVERVVDRLRELGAAGRCTIATGRFRTEMRVALVNDGPVTVLLEVPPAS